METIPKSDFTSVLPGPQSCLSLKKKKAQELAGETGSIWFCNPILEEEMLKRLERLY